MDSILDLFNIYTNKTASTRVLAVRVSEENIQLLADALEAHVGPATRLSDRFLQFIDQADVANIGDYLIPKHGGYFLVVDQDEFETNFEEFTNG